MLTLPCSYEADAKKDSRVFLDTTFGILLVFEALGYIWMHNHSSLGPNIVCSPWFHPNLGLSWVHCSIIYVISYLHSKGFDILLGIQNGLVSGGSFWVVRIVAGC